MRIDQIKEIPTNSGSLILDSHKLAYHHERVVAWEEGERIAPVSVDMSRLFNMRQI